MERLTKIDGAGRNVIEVKRFCKDDDWIISEMTDGITTRFRFHSKAIDKLAEFEDFMEAQGVESLGELESVLYQLNVEASKTKELEQENQVLKARWDALHIFARNRHDFNLIELLGKVEE